jgi:hypothetical protein
MVSSGREAVALAFIVEDGKIGFKSNLQLKITGIKGTSPIIDKGDTYVIAGQYHSSNPGVASLRLSNIGTSRGESCPIKAGTGEFSLTAEVIDVIEDKNRILDILAADSKGNDLGVIVRIVLN